jgi:O-antigen chain-terminating methyltransferase
MITDQDNNGDDLNLPQLMDQIRADAENRKRNSPDHGAPPAYRLLATQGFDALFASHNPSLPLLKLQPELERRDHYHVNDLLGFHDEPFVRNAYLAILKREPDDTGLAQFLPNLRNGRYSKIDVLSSLRFSPEGRNANVQIEGLNRLSTLRKIYRVPVAGYLLRLVIALVRLPVLITNFRRLESHTMAQFDRVAGHINESVAHVNDSVTQLSHQVNGPFRLQINSLLREQERLAQNQLGLKQTHNRLESHVARVNDNTEHIRQRQAAELQALEKQLQRRIDDLIERLQKFKMDVAQQETRLSHLLDGSSHTPVVEQQSQPTISEADHLLDSLYFSLEDVLRGKPEEIKEQVKVYLPFLQKAHIDSDILDVGCGRGEWLEILREAGYKARGIDTNRILVQRCRDLSLDVVEAEALGYLRSLPNESLSAVTAFHFAEHLPLETLVRFLDEAGRTLKPGGLIILETPNPENLLVGSCNFYLDPTHKNPLPIPTLQLLVEARGYCCEEVLKLHAINAGKIEVKDQLTSHLNHYLYGPMNYAIVARKPASA